MQTESLLRDFKGELALMGKPAETIEAIYFDELSVLEPNFKARFSSGELKCSCCGEALKKVGLHSVEVKGNELYWICQSVECVLSTIEQDPSSSR